MTVSCDHGMDANPLVNLCVVDKDSILTRMRDFLGEGLYSISVDIMYLNRTISFPRKYFVCVAQFPWFMANLVK